MSRKAIILMPLYQSQDCKFCRIARHDSKYGINKKIENVFLEESDNFALIPALGPLTENHFLIISKKHYNNLSSMGKKAIKEYHNFYLKISKAKTLKNSKFIEFEHGSTSADNAGASIVHTHIHILPLVTDLINSVKSKLKVISLINNINELSNIKESHIWIRQHRSKFCVFRAMGLPSQFLRREVANLLGHNEWNWKKYPRRKMIKKMLKTWRANGLTL